MSILGKWWRHPKEVEFNVDTILIPVGDSKEFAKRRDPSFKEIDLETWKHRLEVQIEALERENRRLKKYEDLVNSFFERLSHDEEFSRKFKTYVDPKSLVKVRKVEFRDADRS